MYRNSLAVLRDVIICLFSLLNGLNPEFFLTDFDSAIFAFCLHTFAWCNFPHALVSNFLCRSVLGVFLEYSLELVYPLGSFELQIMLTGFKKNALLKLQDRFYFKPGLF